MNSQGFSYSEYPQKDYSEKFKNVTQLLKESWRIYCLKIKTLLGIIGLPVGFSFLFWILIYFLADTPTKYSIWFSVISAISYLGSLFLWLWAIPSLLYNFKENTGARESYKKGFKILGSCTWVYFLLITIITGGFLLFVIPGILFSIWFSLTIFIFVFENKKGLDNLFRSKHLVKEKFREVLARFLALSLIMGLGLSLIFALIIFGTENRQTESQIIQLIGYFIQLFIWPFFLIYGFLIYNNLKEIKTEIPYEEPTRNRKIKYLIPGILGILIVGFSIGFPLFNIFLGRDEPPIDDSDLWLSKIEIPKEENAFYLLTQASEKISLPRGDGEYELFIKMVEGEKWDSKLAEELIKKNEESFKYFEKALELPYFQIPEWQDPENISFETTIPSLSGLREISKLNLIRANYLLTQGKEKDALDLIIRTIKMGQMIQDSPRPSMITYLVGTAVKNIGLQRLIITIPNLTLPPETLKDYVAKLDRFKTNEEGLARAKKIEYITLINTKSKIDAAITGNLSREEFEKLGMEEMSSGIRMATQLNYLYKPNQTQRIFAEHHRNFINNIDKYCSEARLPEIKPLAPSSKIKMLFTENILGKIIYDVMAVNLSGLFDRKCFEDFLVIGTQVLMATKAHQTETGKMPLSLNELVPEYFSEIPKDPFDGKLIRYSPEKKIIYSVGPDLKDSGGSEGKDWRTMEDPSFKIEF